MVTRPELAIELIKWVALFIPALAIMLNTFVHVYDDSLLETIGIAESRKTQAIHISTYAFALAFFALILSLVYLLEFLSILPNLPISGGVLFLAAIVCIFLSVAVTTMILLDFYRASSMRTIDPTPLEELAQSDPETAITLLNVVSNRRQISQDELDLIANEIDLEEKIKQDNQEE